LSSSPPLDNINPDGDADRFKTEDKSDLDVDADEFLLNPDGDVDEFDLKPRWRCQQVRFETHMGFCSTWFDDPLGLNPLVLSMGKKMCG
jgi:hypothetical protein